VGRKNKACMKKNTSFQKKGDLSITRGEEIVRRSRSRKGGHFYSGQKFFLGHAAKRKKMRKYGQKRFGDGGCYPEKFFAALI